MNESVLATRDRLLVAARDTVNRHGLGGASSRAITTAAGANLAAITYHFGSKEALLEAALAEEVRHWVQPAFVALDAAAGDPATQMLEAVRLLTDAFDRVRDRTPALLDAIVSAVRRGDGEVAQLWRDVRARLSQTIAALRDGDAIPAWVHPDAMASLVLATTIGVAVAVTIEPTGPDHRDIASQLGALLLAAQPPVRR